MGVVIIVSIQEASVSFSKTTLFKDLSFNIHEGNKICIIGKNGAGKTTLMNMIVGTQIFDSGKRIELSGLTIGYLTQDIKFSPDQKVYDYLFSGLKVENQNEDSSYMIDMIAHPLQLDLENIMKNLSGGQLRRASLAKTLIENPDLLLLDEPTNHLDFESVQWLENYLRTYRGTLVCISHDRTFLKNISDKVFWLDRGKIRICPKGYGHFEEWSNKLLGQEARELKNREKILGLEEDWANRGVRARRKRNVRRLEEMKAERELLKKDKSLFEKNIQKMELEPMSPTLGSKVIAEFIKVSKKFTEGVRSKTILDQFNIRILKGDKIGVLGNNGSGKTSFLKMLIGDLQIDSGKIKLAKNIEISYFDQTRSNLKENDSLWKNLCPNGDYINVMGKTRHVCGYLKDFLFDPKDATNDVNTLSGGQKNRLLLAKTLANPGNLLILDEPTNDLDMDTLDMLEDILANYKGTLFVVSHDRDFLDQTVNKILAFEGDGGVEVYIGGYSDYEKNRKTSDIKIAKKQKEDRVKIKEVKKLTYKLQYELDGLPKKVENLNKELSEINKQFADPNFFSNSELRDVLLHKSSKLSQLVSDLEDRWLELESMR
jgi:ATP-binding cassette subfamily F protein uup